MLDPNVFADRAAALALEGDAARGHLVFDRACALCHVAAGKGSDYGPNQSDVGLRLTREQIVDAVLQPSKDIKAGFELHQVTLADGAVLTGIVGRGPEGILRLKQIAVPPIDVPVARVVSDEPLRASAMTELGPTLSDQDLSDVAAFLLTQRSLVANLAPREDPVRAKDALANSRLPLVFGGLMLFLVALIVAGALLVKPRKT